MFKARAKSAVIGAAVSIAAVMGCVGSAQAALYTGMWDPAFGPALPNLGWKGSATFFIPDACLNGSGWISNSDACSGGTMKLISAEVDFYNASSDPSGSNVLEVLTIDPLALPGNYIYSMEVSENQLTGVSSGFSAPVQAFSSIAGEGSKYFDLTFLQGDEEGDGKGARLFYTTGSQNPVCAFFTPGSCGYSQGAASVTYALVPEPETYALMLAGLGAIGFMLWRRRS